MSVVHKGGKVLSEIGRKNVWAITSGEKTLSSPVCLLLVPRSLPRKRINENLKAGVYPGTSSTAVIVDGNTGALHGMVSFSAAFHLHAQFFSNSRWTFIPHIY